MISRYKKHFALLMAFLMLLTSAPLNMLAEAFYSPGLRLADAIVDFGIQTSAGVPLTKKELMQGTTLDVQAAFTGSGGPSFTSGEAGVTWDITWQLSTPGPVLLNQNASQPWKASLTPSATAMGTGETTLTVTCVRKSGGVATDTFRASAVIQVVPRRVKVVYHSNYPADAKKANVANTQHTVGTVVKAVDATTVETIPFKPGGMDIGFSADFFKVLNYNLAGYQYVTYSADGVEVQSGTNDKNTKLHLSENEVEATLTALWSSESGTYVNTKLNKNDNIQYMPFTVYYYYPKGLYKLSREYVVPAVYYYADSNAGTDAQPTSVAFQTRSLINALYYNLSATERTLYNEIKNRVKGYRIHYANGGTLDVPVGSYVTHDMNVMPIKDWSLPPLANNYGGTLGTHCYVEVEALLDSELGGANNMAAHFYVLKRNATGLSSNNWYAVGTGIIDTGADRQGDRAWTVDLDNYNGKDYIIQAPSAVQIADSMNISLAEAETVRWYWMSGLNNDGWHVDGIIILKGVNHTVKFVDTGNNVVVRTSSIADTEALPREHVPTKGDLKKVPGKEFMYWAIDGQRIDNGGDGVIGDITSSRLNMVTSNTEVVAVYNPTVRYAYASNQPADFPAAANRPALPGEVVVKNGTAQNPNGSVYLPLVPAIDGFAGKWVLPDGTRADAGALYVLPATLPAGGVVLHAEYQATKAAYTVQYYYEKLDGSYAYAATSNRDGKDDIGKEVSVTAADRAKTQGDRYVVDNLNPNRKYTITINSDPSQNTLKVYYKKATKTVAVIKNWTGTGAAPGAPASFVLQQGSTSIPFTLSDENTSTHQATDEKTVFAYDDKGGPYPYTVTETTTTAGYTKTSSVSGDTHTFTNAYNGTLRDVTATLTWNLQTPTGPADPLVTPESVNLVLKRNGTTIASFALSEGSSWTKTFANQPMYAPDGTPYVYSIEETVPGGYKAVPSDTVTGTGGEDGVELSILNQYTGGLVPGVASMRTATKTFVGGPQISLETARKLLALRRTTANHPGISKIAPNTVLLKSVTDKGNNTFEYTWGDTLWKYDAYGNEYIYQVVEIDPNGSQYTDATVVGDVATIGGHPYNVLLADNGVTNVYIATPIDVTRYKVWNLTNAEDGARVPRSYVSLYRKSDSQASYTLVPDTVKPVGDRWVDAGKSLTETLTWTGLAKTDGGGNLYDYVPYETDENGNRTGVPGYKKTESGTTVTNTFDGKTGADGQDRSRTISVDKAWVGALDGFTISADITLHRALPGGGVGAPYAPAGQQATHTLTATKATSLDGRPEVTWTNLPRYCPNGTEYVYTVVETPITIGYKHTISTAETGNNRTYSITNTYSPVLINVTATNEWKATAGIDISGKKVASLVLPLQRRVGTDPWENVVDSQGNPLTYDFGNQVVPAGNSLTVSYTWKNMPKTCPCGRNYEYRIYQETAPGGYIKSGEGLHITNTYNGMSPGGAAMTLKAQKKWVGLEPGQMRPAVVMSLYRSDNLTTPCGEVRSNSVPHDGGETVYIFDNYRVQTLLRYAPDGTPYTYTVQETDANYSPEVPGYAVIGNGGVVTETKPLVITNKRDPGEITFTVTKVWKDADGKALPAGTNVPAVRLVVLEWKNGQPGAELTQFSHTFGAHALTGQPIRHEFKMPKYTSAGEKLAYSIREIAPNGYMATAVGSSGGHFLVTDNGSGVFENKYNGNTNSKNPSQSGPISLTLKKQWRDLPQGFTNAGNLPEVTLYLKQNGAAMGDAYKQVVAKPTVISYGRAESKWDISGLPKYAMDGTEFVYTVDEETTPNGYVKSYLADGQTVVNTYTGGVTADAPLRLTVNKTWAGVTAGNPLPAAELKLYRASEAEPIATAVISAATYPAAPSVTFTRDGLNNAGNLLPRYDAAGNLYTYRVIETPINGYQSSLNDTNNTFPGSNVLSITNTYDGESNHDDPSKSGPISISLTNITRLMVNTASYPNIEYTLTCKRANETNWTPVANATAVENKNLSFVGGDNAGRFVGSNIWTGQTQFATDGTAYQYSVNTKYNGNQILYNGSDAAAGALPGYACQYNKGNNTPGGWVQGVRCIEVRHIPYQGVLKLTNLYMLNEQTVNGEPFEFEISATGIAPGGLGVIGAEKSGNNYIIKSGDTVYVTGVAHGAILTVTLKNHDKYTSAVTSSGVDGQPISGVSLADGVLKVNFTPANFHTSIDLQANVTLTNKQGELLVRQDFVDKNYNIIAWPKSLPPNVVTLPVNVSIKKDGLSYKTRTITMANPQEIIKVPYGEYTVIPDASIDAVYLAGVFELPLTDAVNQTVWEGPQAGTVAIDADQSQRSIRVVNKYTQEYVGVTVRKEWIDVPKDAAVPAMTFRFLQHQIDSNGNPVPGTPVVYEEGGVVVTLPVPPANQFVNFGELPDRSNDNSIDYFYELQELYNGDAKAVPHGYIKEPIWGKPDPNKDERIVGFKNTYNGIRNNTDPENPVNETVTVSVTKIWTGLRKGHSIPPKDAIFTVYRSYSGRAPEVVMNNATTPLTLTAKFADATPDTPYKQGGIMLVDYTVDAGSVTGLFKYAPDGTEYEYFVREEIVSPAYLVSTQKTITNQDNVFTHAFTVTNTYQPGVYGTVSGNINFTKEWKNIPAGTKEKGMLPQVTVELRDTTNGGDVLATIDAFTTATGRNTQVVYAHQDEDHFALPDLNAPTNTTFKLSRLAKYRPDGELFTYKLKESNLNGYGQTSVGPTLQNGVESYEFTNTYNSPTVTVTATKTWSDVPAGVAVEAKLTLYQNGVEHKTETLSSTGSGNDSCMWTVLKFAPDGSEYRYVVKEAPVNGYMQAVGPTTKGTDGNYTCNITNIYDGITNHTNPIWQSDDPVTLTVQKKWTGLGFGDTAPEVTVTVYNDENEPVGTVNLGGLTIYDEEQTETQTLSGLKRYKPDGSLYTFYGMEQTVPGGYELKNGNDAVANDFHFAASNNTITITNHFTNPTTTFTVEKQWKTGNKETYIDMDAAADVPNIWVQLKQSVTAGETTTTVNYGQPRLIPKGKAGAAAAERRVTWTDLPKYDTQGHPYTYSARELTYLTSQGYLPAQYNGTGTDADPFIIINIYDTSAVYTLSGTKTWTAIPAGAWGADGIFKLYRREAGSTDEIEIENAVPVVKDTDDGTMVTARTESMVFNGVFPIYSTTGRKYSYRLEETVPLGYEVVVERTVDDDNRKIEFNVTNHYTGIKLSEGTASVRGTKLWKGLAPNTDPATVAPVTLTLHWKTLNDDGSLYWETPPAMEIDRTLLFNAALEANTTWHGLPRYSPSGRVYIYEVLEKNVPLGYEKTVDESTHTITNTYKPNLATTSFTATKVWQSLPSDDAVGAPVRFQLRQSVTYHANGQTVTDTVDYGLPVVITDNAGQPRPHQASYTWDNLPKYAPSGTEYVYSVNEVRVPNGYQKTSDDGQTITNTYDGKTDNTNSGASDSFVATVKWVGVPEGAGAAVQLQLKRTSGEHTDYLLPVSVSDTDTATHVKENTWANLPKFAPDGSLCMYSVDLVSVPNGYTAKNDGRTVTLIYDGQTNNGLETPIRQTLDLLASKTWKNLPVGANGMDVTFRLMKVEGQTATVYDTATDKVLNDNGSHYATAIWDSLPKFAPSGAEYAYVVREVTIPRGYAFSQEGNNITNTFDGLSEGGAPVEPENPLDNPTDPGHVAQTVTVKAAKYWEVDGQEVTQGVPTTYLQLMRNGVEEGAAKEMADGQKDAEWTDLYRYAPDGSEYVYSVYEVSIPQGYKMVQTGNDIKNIYDGVSLGGTPDNLPTPEDYATNPTDPGNPGAEASVLATVKWEQVPEGVTVPTVEIKLWRNGLEHGATQTLTSGTTTAEWTGLPKFAPDGTEYTYTVSEVDIPKGYRMVQDGLTITNIYNGISEGGKPDNLPTPENVTNTPTDPNTTNTVTIEATKKWVTPEGVAVPMIELKLWQNFVEHSIPKTLANGETTVEWTGLAKYAPDGTEFKYTVSEARVPKGYRMSQDGLTITNTYDGISEGGVPLPPTPESPIPIDPSGTIYVSIVATNTWKNVPDGVKVPDLAVRLYRDGVKVEDKTIASGSSSAEWTGLAKYGPDGRAYIYTVSAVSIPKGYTYTQKSYHLTHTYDGVSAGGEPIPPVNPLGPDTPNTPEHPFDLEDPANNPTDPGEKEEQVTVRATKIWANVPEDAIVPDIVVRLYRNGVKVEDKIIHSGSSVAEWTELAKYGPEGEVNIYTISEVSIPQGYSMVQKDFEITNTYDGVSAGGEPENLPTPENPSNTPTDPGKKEEQVTVRATKIWANVPEDATVPDIVVRLYRNGVKVEDKTIHSGSSVAEWTELAKYGPEGEIYIYTISEVSIPQGYSMVQKDFEITNTYDGVSAGGEPENLPTPEDPSNTPTDPGKKEEAVTVTATKVWKNVENPAKVPDIDFQLQQNGVAYLEPVKLKAGTTEVKWDGLPKYAPDTAVYTYTVSEVNVPMGFTMKQAGNVITNTCIILNELPIEVDGVHSAGECFE